MHSKFKLSNKIKIMIMSFTSMLMIGIVNNLRGQIGPLIMDDFALNYSQLGFLFSFLSIGAIIIFFLSGKMIEKYGLINIFLYGLVHTAVSLLAVYLSSGYYYLLISFFSISMGLTLLNIVSVTVISMSFSQRRGKMINLLHLFYGLGGIISPYFVTLILKMGFSWAHSFLFSLIFIVIIIIQYKSSRLPEFEASKSQSMLSTKKLLKNKAVILFSLLVFLQVGVEFSLVTWLAPFLKDVQFRTEIVISFFLSLFFISFTFGRLLASIIIEKVNYYDFLIYTQIGGALVILAALLVGRPLTILLSLSGLFFAVQVPTSQAIILDIFGSSGIKVVGFTQTAGTMGAAFLSNWIIGFTNDLFGVESSFVIVIILLLSLVVITIYLKEITKGDFLNH
ncbi:MAG: MFS transporter [Bacillota bacterium]